MITVCSRCKRVISETLQHDPEEKISHGICARCLSILERKIRENAKYHIRQATPRESSLRTKEP